MHQPKAPIQVGSGGIKKVSHLLRHKEGKSFAWVAELGFESRQSNQALSLLSHCSSQPLLRPPLSLPSSPYLHTQKYAHQKKVQPIKWEKIFTNHVHGTCIWNISRILFFFSFLATPLAYGSFQARAWIGAVAASLHHSNIAGSELHLWPTPQLIAMPDP